MRVSHLDKERQAANDGWEKNEPLPEMSPRLIIQHKVVNPETVYTQTYRLSRLYLYLCVYIVTMAIKGKEIINLRMGEMRRVEWRGHGRNWREEREGEVM